VSFSAKSGRYPEPVEGYYRRNKWIPAFAGMTNMEIKNN